MQLKSLVKKFSKFLIITISILMVGCIFNPTIPDENNDALVCRIPLAEQTPSSITWYPVEFRVLNKSIMEGILNGDIQYPTNLIALDVQSYENISINMQQIINHMKDARKIVEESEKYYSNTEKKD